MTIADYLRLLQRSNSTSTVSTSGVSFAATQLMIDVAEGALFRVRAAGWARDPDGGQTDVTVSIDNNRWSTRVRANLARPDVAAANGVDPAVGYDVTLVVPAGAHRLCVQADNVPGTFGAPSTSCRSVYVASDAPAHPLPESATWLETMNYYRTSAGLLPVIDEPAWSDGIVKHLVYLRDTPAGLRTGTYANAHSENPASPYYTPEGAAAGSASNLGGGSTPRDAIEGWITAPFHAIGILRPNLARSAYGQLGTSAGLDVLRGRGPGSAPTSPVLFPANGSVISSRMTRFVGEHPDPRESCGYMGVITGVPFVAMLPSPPGDGVTATVQLPYGPTVAAPDLCVVTASTYVSSDPVYGPTGRSIIQGANAVLIIPREPLTPGTHHVTLTVPGQGAWSWSFAVAN